MARCSLLVVILLCLAPPVLAADQLYYIESGFGVADVGQPSYGEPRSSTIGHTVSLEVGARGTRFGAGSIEFGGTLRVARSSGGRSDILAAYARGLLHLHEVHALYATLMTGIGDDSYAYDTGDGLFNFSGVFGALAGYRLQPWPYLHIALEGGGYTVGGAGTRLVLLKTALRF